MIDDGGDQWHRKPETYRSGQIEHRSDVFLFGSLLARLLWQQIPQHLDVDRWAVVAIGGVVKSAHADLAEVTRMAVRAEQS